MKNRAARDAAESAGVSRAEFKKLAGMGLKTINVKVAHEVWRLARAASDNGGVGLADWCAKVIQDALKAKQQIAPRWSKI